MHFNGRNLNRTVLLQSLTTSSWLYTWEQKNSSNKFSANLNVKGISFFVLILYIKEVKTFEIQESASCCINLKALNALN